MVHSEDEPLLPGSEFTNDGLHDTEPPALMTSRTFKTFVTFVAAAGCYVALRGMSKPQMDRVESLESSKLLGSARVTNPECINTDTASIFKYTVASTDAVRDGKWAVEYLGASNNNLTYPCGDCGKVSLMTSVHDDDGNRYESLDFNLHYVFNHVTPSGPFGIYGWDKYFKELHEFSFSNNQYNQFMDYSLTVYVPCADSLVEKLVTNGQGYLARQVTSSFDDETWYSITISSPGGKIIEVMSTSLSVKNRKKMAVMDWSHYENECSNSHLSITYSKDQYQEWYENLNGATLTEVNGGYPPMMPIRANIALPDHVEEMKKWYKIMFPALGNNMVLTEDVNCTFATGTLPYSAESDFNMEIRLISNPKAYAQDYNVNEFVTYVNEVNMNYTGPNYGWSGWWDRHLGIELTGDCMLDDYMQVYDDHNISFHPHTRVNSDGTNGDGQPTDHMWSEGTGGWGIEMLGNINFTYSDCYYTFDWCSWDTNPTDSSVGQVCAGDSS